MLLFSKNVLLSVILSTSWLLSYFYLVYISSETFCYILSFLFCSPLSSRYLLQKLVERTIAFERVFVYKKHTFVWRTYFCLDRPRWFRTYWQMSINSSKPFAFSSNVAFNNHYSNHHVADISVIWLAKRRAIKLLILIRY